MFPHDLIADYAFQFTHPERDATKAAQIEKELDEVSIHASREGCDFTRPHIWEAGMKFQFTHPERDATGEICNAMYQSSEFQFTHPERDATAPNALRPARVAFQFTHPERDATISPP